MFGVNDAISKREEWKMQGKRMHGDGGKYLVNMGEKCNLMNPWTKVQKFHCSYGSNYTIVLQWPQAIVSQLLSSRKHLSYGLIKCRWLFK